MLGLDDTKIVYSFTSVEYLFRITLALLLGFGCAFVPLVILERKTQELQKQLDNRNK